MKKLALCVGVWGCAGGPHAGWGNRWQSLISYLAMSDFTFSISQVISHYSKWCSKLLKRQELLQSLRSFFIFWRGKEFIQRPGSASREKTSPVQNLGQHGSPAQQTLGASAAVGLLGVHTYVTTRFLKILEVSYNA